MIVELHILQNFAPSCLNRDDTNTPKDCIFGGHRRARVSSQCLKREIRWNDEFRKGLTGHLSSRSLRFPTQVYEELTKLGVEENSAKEIGRQLEAIAKKEASKAEDSEGKGEKEKKQDAYELDIFKTPQMVFYTEDEVRECAKQIKALLDKGSTLKEVFKKDKKGKFTSLPVFPVPRSADIALFGRMVTSAHFKNIDAACQVAHAISTHKVGVESDFYTAVDDLQPAGETGAGMMGDIQFNSACFYRYANIDLNQLKENLAGRKWDKASEAEKKDANDLANKIVKAFIRAAVAAIPSGKKNSFAPQNPPDFVCAIVRDNGEWSLANAFSKPVNEGNLVSNSIDALINYWGRLNTAYPPQGSIKAKPAFTLTDSALTGLDNVNTIEKLVTVVNQAIAKDC